eukprot:Pgem_evm1s18520
MQTRSGSLDSINSISQMISEKRPNLQTFQTSQRRKSSGPDFNFDSLADFSFSPELQALEKSFSTGIVQSKTREGDMPNNSTETSIKFRVPPLPPKGVSQSEGSLATPLTSSISSSIGESLPPPRPPKKRQDSPKEQLKILKKPGASPPPPKSATKETIPTATPPRPPKTPIKTSISAGTLLTHSIKNEINMKSKGRNTANDSLDKAKTVPTVNTPSPSLSPTPPVGAEQNQSLRATQSLQTNHNPVNEKGKANKRNSIGHSSIKNVNEEEGEEDIYNDVVSYAHLTMENIQGEVGVNKTVYSISMTGGVDDVCSDSNASSGYDDDESDNNTDADDDDDNLAISAAERELRQLQEETRRKLEELKQQAQEKERLEQERKEKEIERKEKEELEKERKKKEEMERKERERQEKERKERKEEELRIIQEKVRLEKEKIEHLQKQQEELNRQREEEEKRKQAEYEEEQRILKEKQRIAEEKRKERERIAEEERQKAEEKRLKIEEEQRRVEEERRKIEDEKRRVEEEKRKLEEEKKKAEKRARQLKGLAEETLTALYVELENFKPATTWAKLKSPKVFLSSQKYYSTVDYKFLIRMKEIHLS